MAERGVAGGIAVAAVVRSAVPFWAGWLAFSTDYALAFQLENQPKRSKVIRNSFNSYPVNYANERDCRPIPEGEWLAESLVWQPAPGCREGTASANLARRYELYAESLSRREDQSAGERIAHLLAAWCSGEPNASFLSRTKRLFPNQWQAVGQAVQYWNITGGLPC